MRRRLLLLCLLSTGACTHWTEIRSNEGSRIWLISTNRREVLRCIDATPTETPFRGNLKVFCKEALIYDDVHDPLIDASEPSKVLSSPPKPPEM